jgi:hypothetical protein
VALALLLGAGGAAALEPGLLAPDPGTLAAHRARLEERLGRADAVGEAVARVHNRLAERQARGKAAPCADGEGRSLVARARALGLALREEVQAARAQAARVKRLAEAPTVRPLLTTEERARLAALDARSGEQVRLYGELSAWHAAHVPPAERCAVQLAPAPGLSLTAPGAPAAEARGERPVAVLGVGGGHLCPGAVPADGRVAVLPGGRGCYAADAACGCAPVPLLPGAVLGP